MPYRTLIAPAELEPHLGDPSWAVLDCRFDLARPEKGESEYLAAHIPGAVYVHLERDVSAPLTGRNGRHPLPAPQELAALFSRVGIDAGVQVVAYDDGPGQIAARLWWSLRFLGHDAVAVLDGGLAAWLEQGLPLRGGRETRPPRQFEPGVREDMRVDASGVSRAIGDAAKLLVDARDPRRYRGEEEPLDPVAGHIPRARNHPWQENVDSYGRFLAPEALRERFENLLGGIRPSSVVSYCGSGVTACHNLLALEHAGLPGAKLYPGSWSEWCADPTRPIGLGEEE